MRVAMGSVRADSPLLAMVHNNQIARMPREHGGTGFVYDDAVDQARADPLGMDEYRGLDRNNHAGLEKAAVVIEHIDVLAPSWRESRRDAVSRRVQVVFEEPSLANQVLRDLMRVMGGHTWLDDRHRRLAGILRHCVDLAGTGRRRAHAEVSRDRGTIAPI